MLLPKIVFLTGGNNGIGYETVKAFLQSDKPYHVLLSSHPLAKAKHAIQTLHKEMSRLDQHRRSGPRRSHQRRVVREGFGPSPGQPRTPRRPSSTTPAHPPPRITRHPTRGLTPPMGDLRPRLRRRHNHPPRLLHPGLRRERRRHAAPDLDVRAAAAPVFVAGLSQITLASETCFPTPPQPDRVAQAGGLRDGCGPLQHDGAQHADAGLDPQADGGRRMG